MPNKTVSVDEYLSEHKHCSDDGVVYKAVAAPKSFDAEERTCRFVMSSQELDRDHDVVVTNGIDLAHFQKNPIALLNHWHDNVIGAWKDVAKLPKRLEGTVTLAAEGTATYIDELAGLMEQGFIRAASIGFRITDLKRREMEDGNYARGYIIEGSDLLECSVVSVPANALALAKAAKGGNGIATEYLEQILDTWQRNKEGLIVPREDFEDAHKEATGNKSSVTVSKDVKVIGDDNGYIEWEAEADSIVIRLSPKVEEGIKASIDELVTHLISPADDEKSAKTEADIDAEAEEDAIQSNLDDEAEKSLMERIGSFFGLKKPEPPKPADPETVAALSERAKAIREAA